MNHCSYALLILNVWGDVMKIVMSFYSLKDMSSLLLGEAFLKILLSHGLTIEKADNQEPIKKIFSKNNFTELWMEGRGLEGEFSLSSFLFKGSQKIKFKGMVTSRLNTHRNSKSFNGIHLWLTIPKNFNFSNLIPIGDDIFNWSEAVYGYITEEALDPSNNELIGNVYDGIPGLFWVNYFGAPYIKSSDFHCPNDSTSIGRGFKLILAESPNDGKLRDSDFLSIKKEIIGKDWFCSHPRNLNLKIPIFDRSAITMSNEYV
jgi:hypothetical protein